MKKNITELLGIEYPIIQGGMAHISNHSLAAAVSEAGGLGILTSMGFSAEELRNEILKVRQQTKKPFGVNLMLQQDNISELVEIILEEKVPVVTTGAGTPKHFAADLQEAGIKLIPVVATVYHAQKMEALGVDAVIAEGYEAGGHIGGTATLPLVSQVTKVVNIPVIAAGGIANGQAMVAMKALGAQGVQIGTLFLSAEECPIGKNYRQKLIDADDTATILTGQKWGSPVRSFRNELLDEYLKKEFSNSTREELEKLTVGSFKRAIDDDDVDTGSAMAGQAAGLIKAIRPAKEIIESLIEETKDTKKQMVDG